MFEKIDFLRKSDSNTGCAFTAIAWRKKSFRKYFDSVDNWIAFHKLAHRLLEAPTVEITHLIQDEIVQWLGEKKEKRAQEWF